MPGSFCSWQILLLVLLIWVVEDLPTRTSLRIIIQLVLLLSIQETEYPRLQHPNSFNRYLLQQSIKPYSPAMPVPDSNDSMGWILLVLPPRRPAIPPSFRAPSKHWRWPVGLPVGLTCNPTSYWSSRIPCKRNQAYAVLFILMKQNKKEKGVCYYLLFGCCNIVICDGWLSFILST